MPQHFHAMRAAVPAEIRPSDEIASWKARDPAARFEQHALGQGLLSAGEIAAIRARAQTDLDTAVAFAEHSAFPDPKNLLVDMFAE